MQKIPTTMFFILQVGTNYFDPQRDMWELFSNSVDKGSEPLSPFPAINTTLT